MSAENNSTKRHRDLREDTSELIHTHHKRLKDDHGDAHRVDPDRFNPRYAFSHAPASSAADDAFKIALPTDDDDEDDDDDLDCNKMAMQQQHNSNSNSNSNSNDTDFGLLLYELASLDVNQGNSDASSAVQRQQRPQTCPICSMRISLQEFADHVHHCVAGMDDTQRNDLRSQSEKDHDFATSYALKHGYQIQYDFQCPSCGKQLFLGQSMNEHVNQCLDEQLKKEEMKKNAMAHEHEHDDDEDDDIGFDADDETGVRGGGGARKIEPLSREQMIECASKLMTLQQGTQQFDKMLDMFGALGFNKNNVKSVLDIEKKQKHLQTQTGAQAAAAAASDVNGNNHNHNHHQQQQQFMSPIVEEDDDLARKKTQQTEEDDAFFFDDEEL